MELMAAINSAGENFIFVINGPVEKGYYTLKASPLTKELRVSNIKKSPISPISQIKSKSIYIQRPLPGVILVLGKMAKFKKKRFEHTYSLAFQNAEEALKCRNQGL